MEKAVDGYADYSVTDDGRVYSTKYGYRVELKLSQHKGYRRVALSSQNRRRIFPVHCLVAKAFIPNPDSKPFVNHIDGNKRNNHVSNLQWCTAKENQHHAYDVLNIRNGKTGYTYAKLYPNEELRNRLVELGVPRWRHNLAELGEMLPTKYLKEVFHPKNIPSNNEYKHEFIIAYGRSERDEKPKIGEIYNGRKEQYYHIYSFILNKAEHLQQACVRFEAKTEADARAKCLIYLLENKLITL